MFCYLFALDKGFDLIKFKSLLSYPIEINMITPLKGEIKSNENIDALLEKKAFDIHNELKVNVSFLRTCNFRELSLKLLDKCLSYAPNSFRYMSDMIFKELTFGDYSSMPYLNRALNSVPRDLLSTVGTYLRSGLDGKKASESLYIHRNTFLFRIEKFEKITGLDVRDYHDALLLELYFQLAAR